MYGCVDIKVPPHHPETNLFSCSLPTVGSGSKPFSSTKRKIVHSKTKRALHRIHSGGKKSYSTKFSGRTKHGQPTKQAQKSLLNWTCSEILTAWCDAWLRAPSSELGYDRIGGGENEGEGAVESKSTSGRRMHHQYGLCVIKLNELWVAERSRQLIRPHEPRH